jgi:adenylate kinase
LASRTPGICDLDGSELVQRVDDREETVRARMAQQIPPLRDVVEHYRATGVLRSVDGLRPIDEVTSGLLAATDLKLGAA